MLRSQAVMRPGVHSQQCGLILMIFGIFLLIPSTVLLGVGWGGYEPGSFSANFHRSQGIAGIFIFLIAIGFICTATFLCISARKKQASCPPTVAQPGPIISGSAPPGTTYPVTGGSYPVGGSYPPGQPQPVVMEGYNAGMQQGAGYPPAVYPTAPSTGLDYTKQDINPPCYDAVMKDSGNYGPGDGYNYGAQFSSGQDTGYCSGAGGGSTSDGGGGMSSGGGGGMSSGGGGGFSSD